MGIVIATANQKGGVGKTITTTCLAAILTEKKYKVLTVSLDPQRNFDMVAGEGVVIGRKDTNTLSMLHVLQGLCTIRDAIVHTERLGDLVRASSSLYQWTGEQVLTPSEYRAVRDNHEALVKLLDSRLSSGNSMKALDNYLKEVKDDYNYILIDTNPSLTLLTLNSLYAADYVVIPAFPDQQSTEAIIELWDTINGIRFFNPGRNIDIAGILMTRCNKRSIAFRRHEIKFTKLAAKIGTRLFDTKIRQSAKAAEYVELKVDLLKYDPKGNTTQDYRAFTDELLKYIRKNEKEKKANVK